MIVTMTDEIAVLYRHAEKNRLVDHRPTATVLDRAAIEAVLPHRDPFLLVDRVTMLDSERDIVIARYDLARAREIFTGHFPDRPVYPGVLQIETVAQTGLIAGGIRNGGVKGVAVTHVLAARFMWPVPPDGEIEVIARIVEDGLFMTIVGQVLHGDKICSVSAISGLSGE
ncbi:beta-hydroxyacyl-ACP dehydratase [Kibdelosporangium philippinense]|uniref:Beta-hydroxyacyl-ACP dehydratase n=1 Tax=Kibdelosporangium philippinense TaxID=211113 RepID=A0ABS8Z665_9PSEU|nr:3-hydroxyacyl-ACP dehydratase FabZ family protein [Kibdelosporangium philippinense]MCE7002126.1 beta-hydroxyacyl-ACP dehydratase [Kibdelosporangium philippinense]